MAAWRYGNRSARRPRLARIAKLTPRDDFLIGALFSVLSSDSSWRLARPRFDTQFGGAAFKRFLRVPHDQPEVFGS